MPRYIIKLKDQYLEWSTVVDAPITTGMTLKAFKIYYQIKYGNSQAKYLDERLTRVERMGTSHLCASNESLHLMLSYNRAGKNETTLTADQIYDFYCVRQCEGSKPEGVPEED